VSHNLDNPGADRFGCDVCRAVPANRGELPLEHVRPLYEESHEGYCLHRCPDCGQLYLEQFQEITWLPNGEDDIWLRWMPLTAEEVAGVERLFPPGTENGDASELARLMHRRPRLTRDPSDRFYWCESAWDAGNLYPPG
jgi:hypothetical protein